MDAIFNDKDETHPVNMPNAGGALPGFPDDLVVEVLGRCHGGGIDVVPAKPLPRHVRGLVEMLGEYQALAAETAWNGTRDDGIRALSREPARPPGRGRRACLRRARVPRTATTCPSAAPA